MNHFLKTYRYELIAALSGAVVMMLELVGARMVAPYFGTSIYVWTAMIGVILGSLSVGYWYGGKLADKAATDRILAIILSTAAILIGFSVQIEQSLLATIARLPFDLRLQAVLAALLLFAPASCLLGVVSPYVVKLKLSSLKTAGSSVGQLYAAGTAGSIIGTFATGYFLVAWFGNYTLGLFLVVMLIAVSFAAEWSVWRWQRLVVAVVAALALFVPVAFPAGIIADVDSAYGRYQVSEGMIGGFTIRQLSTDNRAVQSVYAVGFPDMLVFDYTKGFKQAADAYGPLQRALIVGGGAYTIPALLARQQPAAMVDTVEIDPKLDEIARQYFDFHQTKNLNIIHQDGRVFLNQNKQTYDLVFMDAFSSSSPPYQLATIEATLAVKRAIVPAGLVVANVLARPQSNDAYLAATYQTYRHVFDSVKVYRVQPLVSLERRQNLMFVMGSKATVERVAASLKQYKETKYPGSGQVLTDDYAPVDQLINMSEL